MNTQDKELNEQYLKTSWGKLLHEVGFDPVNTESAARSVARHAAKVIEEYERRLNLINNTIFASDLALGSDDYFYVRDLCTRHHH